MHYYNKDVEDIFKELDTDRDGISTNEANSRLNKFGRNILEEKKGTSPFKMFISQFKDPMIIILIIVDIFMRMKNGKRKSVINIMFFFTK